MKKKRSGAMAVSIILVIVAMIIGLGIGFMIGKSYGEKGKTEEPQGEAILETASPEASPVIETEAETVAETETEASETEAPETEAGSIDSEGGAIVMQVGDHKVSMSEVNARLYALRDYYIQNYGEEPWDQKLDSGITVAEEAKETLKNDIIRAEVFMDKAEEMGVVVTDEIRSMCEDEAKQRMEALGPEVTRVFGLTEEALASVYLKAQVITEVTNVISDKAREELLADPANQGLDEGTLEAMIAEKVKVQEEEWFADCPVSYSEVWDNIVVGSVG